MWQYSIIIKTLWLGKVSELMQAMQSHTQELEKVSVLAEYTKKISGEDVMSDLHQFFRSNTGSSSLLEALCHYLIEDFFVRLDTLPENFTSLTKEQKSMHLETLFSETEKDVLLHYSLQEIEQYIDQIVSFYLTDMHRVVVQSVRPCSSAIRKKIRESFMKKFTRAFVTFRVDASLLGGMRTVVDGEIHDDSWLAKIQYSFNP